MINIRRFLHHTYNKGLC